MDNDVLRRGKPTVHVQFGQAQAMLAGDAMQALAFEVLTPDEGVDPLVQARLCALLARAAGHSGMAGGQAIDLASVGKPLDEQTLRDMHRRKTGALLQASVLLGAACGPCDARALRALTEFGASIGLAFQVVDDVLDVTQASEVLGKTAGKDLEQNKPTYVQLMGLQRARDYARELRAQAHDALATSGLTSTGTLSMLADKVVDREN
jgi:farnesyl diphosphate synthase